MSKEKSVAIIVPFYRSDLSVTERVAMERLQRVLTDYPVIYIVPESLRIADELVGSRMIKLDDRWFESVISYNDLMLSEEFYSFFLEYEYILIHQLDAFVFVDRLREFCEMQYDYYGAPVPKYFWPFTESKLNESNGFYVGNGGFSLRRVSACLNALRYKDEFMEWCHKNDLDATEDKFYSYVGAKGDSGFRLPDTDLAVDFSIESNFKNRYKHLEQHLPFGCHSWSKPRYLEIWKNIIASFAEDKERAEALRDLKGLDYYEEEYISKRGYLLEKLIRHHAQEKLRTAVRDVVSDYENVFIRGAGKAGRCFVRFLNLADYNDYVWVDKSAQEVCLDQRQYEVRSFDETSIEKEDALVILASTRFAGEMEDELLESGFHQNAVIAVTDFYTRVIESYYGMSIEEAYEQQ